MDQAIFNDFAQWLNSVPGQYARAWQQQQLDRILTTVFGYHAIQIGLPQWQMLGASRISRQWCVVSSTDYAIDRKGLVCADPAYLPFDSQSIDLLVLPHVLEWAADPHQVLREAERVLMPEGRIVISGFNPWSLWGVRDRIPGIEPYLPVSSLDFLSAQRVRDWLRLLSFDIEETMYGCYAPLCREQSWQHRWQRLDAWGGRWWPIAGAVYMVLAVKRVQAVRMVGPSWQTKKRRMRRRPVVVAGGARLKE
ncbi:class I SAM-dependent methyltransferase [Alcaligenes endophyticus]|uniref:Class I SAM-dependent methyltransferase n=1 Tax=Alcaligenes endophyticus TaxID=1929088 RepID=A0ABT8EMB7_9BURK|nr:class I SAM-dependent methyltransferase [Alcaligenes endophyticus]MCX5590993.1 class I SAM-dependent methyltransferase [Alcaligenes endophyticus]MDN4122430.1 class I SAM-dependent methyltransferase [Alcaligenes endophyticus]